MNMKTFKPTPFNLTEAECDDILHGMRRKYEAALADGDFPTCGTWNQAIRMIETARMESHEIRSKARLALRERENSRLLQKARNRRVP